MRESVSVIVPTRDRDAVVGRALSSARRADPRAQIIVVAVDASPQLLRAAGQYDAEVIADPGAGLAGAWSIGVDRARGDLIVFLNDDDVLLPGSLDDLPPTMEAGWEGAAIVGSDRGCRLFPAAGVLTAELVLVGPLHFNRYFWRREALTDLGSFDTRFHLVADREVMLRAHREGLSFTRLSRPVYAYLTDSGSRTFAPDGSNRDAILREQLELFRVWRPALPVESRRAAAAVHLWWLIRELGGDRTSSRILRGLRDVLDVQRSIPTDLLMWFLRHHRRRRPVASRRIDCADLSRRVHPHGMSGTP